MFSHSLDSCVPAPVCKTENYALNSLKDVQAIDYYLGDANKANWQATGRPVIYQGDSLLLTMAPDTVGTLLASTHYVWYGKISATMTTSPGAGVVTAFIMMSDVKDEIDFEFVGVDTKNAQSNYYFQGHLDYTHSENLTVGNTVDEAHTYTIDWKPTSITWEIDGKPMRTLKKSDTWNDKENRYDFPQTPSRVMLSLWPAGLPSNGQGTINWAGGLVDWDSPDMVNGYYAAMFKDISVECYPPPSDAQVSGSKSYVYTDVAGQEGNVEITDKVVVLSSLYASGEDPGKDPYGQHKGNDGNKPSSTSSADSKPSFTPQSVPGMVGGGSRQDSSSNSDSGVGSGGTSGGTDTAGEPLSTGASVPHGFQQNDNTGGAALTRDSPMVGGSVFAVVIAMLALVVI
jgi:hypothetical protein